MTKENRITSNVWWFTNQRSTIIGNKRAVYTNQTFSANKDKFDFSGNITVNYKATDKMATLLMLKVTNQWV
jgi:hypothetical protein